MNNIENITKISKGILRAVILTIIMLVIYAIFMSFVDTSEKTNSVVYLVISCLSIVYGAMFASKSIGKRGYIVGSMVAFIYMIIVTLIFLMGNDKNAVFNIITLYKFIIAMAIGALSGMLGINI